jgi:hypothetical protein
MGINNYQNLYEPQDALALCQGKFCLRRGNHDIYVTETNVLEAAEILIAINDAENLTSQAEVIERAMSYKWGPVEVVVVSQPERGLELQQTQETGLDDHIRALAFLFAFIIGYSVFVTYIAPKAISCLSDPIVCVREVIRR